MGINVSVLVLLGMIIIGVTVLNVYDSKFKAEARVRLEEQRTLQMAEENKRYEIIKSISQK